MSLLLDTAQSSTAGVITAIATLVTAVGGLLAVFIVLIPILRNTRVTTSQVESIHTIVNQQRTDAQRYNIALTEALRKAGIAVPIDQSLPVTGQPDASPGQPS